MGASGRAALLGHARGPDGPSLSPTLTALFVGLFGLATVASIFALLIQVFPVREPRADLGGADAGSSAAPTAQATAAPAPRAAKRARVLLPSPWRLASLAKEPGIRVVSGEMNRRAFIAALGEAGVPKAETYRILKAMTDVVKLDRAARHDKFAVAMSLPAKRAVAFEYERSPVEIYQARENAEGLLVGSRLDMKIAFAEVAGSFYIAKDIRRGVAASVFEDDVVAAVDRAFHGRISTEAFEEGGTVRAIVTEMTSLGAFVSYQQASAVEYRPADPAGKPVRSYYFEGSTYRGYVDERGRAPSQNGWRSPVPGAVVSSPFNPKRMHPVLKKVMPHQGTDYAAAAGTPVYSAFRGTVSSVGVSGGYGNLVTIDHPDGVQTYYAHLSRFAAGLKSGQRVGTHQLVGYVGSTGRSTGPHLHFGAKKDGKFFDPMKLNLDAWSPLPAADRAAFLSLKQQLDLRLEAIPLPEPVPDEPAPMAEDASAPDPAVAEPAPSPGQEPEEPDEEGPGGAAPSPAAPRPSGSKPRTGASPGGQLAGEDLSVEPE
jgi:murein DD-endopeptidase MepM/ murein hydrolase activator NlpD